jgi:hypothetical protein
MKFKPVIAVDWDGTCVESVWPKKGDWLPGAKKALKRLTRDYTVNIWTTRIVGVNFFNLNEVLPRELVEKEIAYIRGMLDDAGLQEVEIFETYPHGVPGKLGAVAYIDDKAVRFDGNWPRTLRQLNRLGV